MIIARLLLPPMECPCSGIRATLPAPVVLWRKSPLRLFRSRLPARNASDGPRDRWPRGSSLLRKDVPFPVVDGRQMAGHPRHVPGRHFPRPLRGHRVELRVDVAPIQLEIGPGDEFAEEY